MSATTVENLTAPDTEKASPAASLRKNRTFLALCLGHGISIIGDGFHTVALGLWVLTTTGSSTAMGIVMTVKILTTILLGPLAGTFVDRTDRRRLMIAMDLVRTALVGVVAYLMGVQGTSFAAILALTGLISVASQFFSPAFQASLVNIVDKEALPQASSLLQVITTLAQVAGPFLGGMVVGLFGGRTALVVDAASFAVSAALILAGGAFASPRRDVQGSFWEELKDGFRYIRSQPVVRGVVTLAPVVNFFGNAIGGVLLPVLAVKVWLASSGQYGALEGTFPLGFAIGASIYMAVAGKLKQRGKLMFVTMAAASALMAVVPLVHSVTAAMPLSVLSGIFLAVPNVLFQVLMQSETPPEVQGRVFGALNSLASVTAPVAFLLAGRLADLFSPVLVASAFGVCLLVAVVVCMGATPALRQYR